MSTLSPGAVVYLAGPMDGYHRSNFDAFAEAREALRAQVDMVTCPAEEAIKRGFDPDAPVVYGLWWYMAQCLPLVCWSTAVVLLPGWRESDGAMIEATVATMLGLPLYEWPGLTETTIGGGDS